MIKADLHVHTCFSIDSCTPLERVMTRCRDRGMDCLAIADHNTIAGALQLKAIAPFSVIVAEEVATTAGEIMGLFLTEEIPAGLSPRETIARIKGQGGLVNIPHPYGRSIIGDSNKLLTPEIIAQVDMIEVFNSRTPFAGSSAKARDLARRHGKPSGAGSDAHTAGEIGRAYVEMPPFEGPEEFLVSLSRGTVFGQRSHPFIHFASTWARTRKTIAALGSQHVHGRASTGKEAGPDDRSPTGVR